MADHLFMTDAEIAKALGLKEQGISISFQVLEIRGCPKYDEFFPTLRYWPAVKASLDKYWICIWFRAKSLMTERHGGRGIG